MRRVLLLLLATAPAAAQTPSDTLHLTLDLAVQRALDRSFAMRLARADVLEANGQVREAMSAALPQVTGTLTYTRQFASIFKGLGGTDTSSLGDLFKNTPFGAANAWNFQIQATQLLWSGGKVGSGLSAAKEARSIAALGESETTAEVGFQVKQAYWNAALQHRLLAIATGNLDQARAQLRQVQLFRQAGTRAEYDLLRAQVDAANQEPAVVAARNDLDLAMLELKRLLDLPADQPIGSRLRSSRPMRPFRWSRPTRSGPERPALAQAGRRASAEGVAGRRARIAGRRCRWRRPQRAGVSPRRVPVHPGSVPARLERR
jgi:outer membrane protein TolC